MPQCRLISVRRESRTFTLLLVYRVTISLTANIRHRRMPVPIFDYMIRRQSPVVGMKTEEFSDAAVFRERVEKLESAQRKYQGIPTSRITPMEKPDKFTFEANTPDIEEVASLARNFRFFYADKEPTQFQKILTKVRRCTQDEWACAYIDWLAEQYKEAMKATQISADLGHPVSNRKIIDLWFNSEFFHTEKLKKQELVDIHAAIGEVPSLFQLYVAIAHCSSLVRSLYFVVHALDVEHQFVYTPNHHFSRAHP